MRGKLVPDFISDLAGCLGAEQEELLAEVKQMVAGIEHIKQIVAAQQSTASHDGVRTATDPARLMDTALMLEAAAPRHGIEIRRRFEPVPCALMDEHKVLQVLVNLISNARHALKAHENSERLMTLGVRLAPREGGAAAILFEVGDNGVGIPPGHLTKIFSHGFTTKQGGHGFGLHGAVNAAGEMGGSLRAFSPGPGQGAVFTLEIPFAPATLEASCH